MTEFGLPQSPERPVVNDATRISASLYWFSPDPAVFGSAATGFVIEISGQGKVSYYL